MYMIVEVSQYVAVASFSEAWIEITYAQLAAVGTKNVASFSEAWIEIQPGRRKQRTALRRLLLGGVD